MWFFFSSQKVSTYAKADFHQNQNINLFMFFQRLFISRDRRSCHTWHVKQAMSFCFKRIKSFLLLSVPVAYSEHGSLCIDPLCKQRPSRCIVHMHFHNLLSFLSSRVSLISQGCVSKQAQCHIPVFSVGGGRICVHPS